MEKEIIKETDSAQAENKVKLKILAVDDSDFMLGTISSVLCVKYDMFLLTKPELVGSFLQHTTPDLFLLDYNMPGLNGFELLSIIRKFEKHKETPVIFLTSTGTPQHVASAVSLGACDYVVKPLNAEALLAKVAKHLAAKKSIIKNK